MILRSLDEFVRGSDRRFNIMDAPHPFPNGHTGEHTEDTDAWRRQPFARWTWRRWPEVGDFKIAGKVVEQNAISNVYFLISTHLHSPRLLWVFEAGVNFGHFLELNDTVLTLPAVVVAGAVWFGDATRRHDW